MPSKIPKSEFHQSIRGYFAGSLYNEMVDDPKIRLVVADLGYAMMDKIRDDFSDRFVNCGASEQLALGIGVGMALSGLRPFIYSITTFLLFRPAEWIRNYLNHEQIPVRLIGSGLERDYEHDGISHQPSEAELYLYSKIFPNVSQYCPASKEQVPELVHSMVGISRPSFICLRR